MKYPTHEQWMEFGKSSGCHQMPERSFFYRGKQFPICARCTGVLIGRLVAYALFFFCTPPMIWCIAGCGVMFLDWYVQYIGVLKSTNRRRLITGLIGGYSFVTLCCMILREAVFYAWQLLRG